MSNTTMTRDDFIKAMGRVLAVKIDFEKLRYIELRGDEVHGDYITVQLITGDAFTFDVTNMSNEKIYRTLAFLECGHVPDNHITDNAKLIMIAKCAKEWGTSYIVDYGV